ncbi:uncharacterized protein [Coffea arabica]|uniref:Zinc finger MYM-type protein 1-like n=1 Tax=Coffea arabica TaxID=13443 RepID=A0A6P6X3A7_COFAR|nr:uncharacterized protein LOC113738926 [Coffea arabica]
MAIVLRFVDKQGYIRERFFDIVHVHETNFLTLKKEICDVLSRHNLSVQNIRGQGYDGITTSQEVIPVEQFFTYLPFLINLISSSCKRVDQLRVARATRIAELIAIDELETEYEEICSVLIDVINYGNTSTQRSEVDRVYDFMTSFDFVLVMHMMRDILGFAQVLSQALQCKSQDILNALKLVSVTKDRLQSYRDNGWNELFTNVKTFCDARNIEMSDMNELCQVLAKTRKSMFYILIDRLIRLILILPVSTATTERAFSAMKIIKTYLRSRMEEDFLANSMIMYIEKEIARTFDINSIIDDFDKIKSRRAQFHMSYTVK